MRFEKMCDEQLEEIVNQAERFDESEVQMARKILHDRINGQKRSVKAVERNVPVVNSKFETDIVNTLKAIQSAQEKQTSDISLIKNCAVFFVVLSCISIMIGFLVVLISILVS